MFQSKVARATLLRSATVAVALGLGVAALMMAAFFALNYWSLGRGGEARVRAAFAEGVLVPEQYLRGDAVRGFHQFNDCLILSMAIDQKASVEQLVVSPSLPFDFRTYNPCRPTAGEPVFYHNYIHGQTMLVRFFLPVLPVEFIRAIYRVALTLVIMTGVILSMVRLAKGEQAAPFLIAFLALARFFGLETFGQSLGHAPSDVVLAMFLLFLASGNLSGRDAILGSAVFGALTMIFELMTGGLPLGLAAIIGLTWFALRRKDVRTVGLSALAFTVAAIACLAIKFAAVALVFGPSELLSIGGDLSHRIGGDAPRPYLVSVLFNMESMMSGLNAMAAFFVLVAIGAGAWGGLGRPSTEGRLLALSTAPIFLWFIIFHQHTAKHAMFMDRMLAWVIFAGFALFVLRLQPSRTSPGYAGSHIPPPASPDSGDSRHKIPMTVRFR